MSPPPVPGPSKLTVRAMPDPSPASPDSSFNTDRLESLQSAEHIRQSMQKYLADKHEHLKKTSQLLADKTGANPETQQSEKTSNTAGSRPTSLVRSLEDLRSVDTGSVYSNPDLNLGPPSLPVNPHLPLARFLYSSDSNLSQLEVLLEVPASFSNPSILSSWPGPAMFSPGPSCGLSTRPALTSDL